MIVFLLFLLFCIKFLTRFIETLETISLETDTETATSETETRPETVSFETETRPRRDPKWVSRLSRDRDPETESASLLQTTEQNRKKMIEKNIHTNRLRDNRTK